MYFPIQKSATYKILAEIVQRHHTHLSEWKTF